MLNFGWLLSHGDGVLNLGRLLSLYQLLIWTCHVCQLRDLDYEVSQYGDVFERRHRGCAQSMSKMVRIETRQGMMNETAAGKSYMHDVFDPY